MRCANPIIASFLLIAFGSRALAQTTAPAGDAALHMLRSEDQYQENELRVLVPDHLAPGKKYPVLYVLPVYPGAKPAATAIEQARVDDLHNRFQVICVSPAFDRMPWYADHATDRHL